MLGLPDSVHVCLFDLDGVLTDTASVHRAAWKDTFDPVLKAHGLPEFTADDYAEYVDGKPRLDGTRDFFASRNLDLPEGDDDDPDDAETIHAVAKRKNAEVQQHIQDDGVVVFDDARVYLEAARAAGLRRIVVSSSANTEQVLQVTGLVELVEGRVDGRTIDEQHMRGKPAPDSFLAGAALVGADPSNAAVFEDATAGAEAGRSGRFGAVVGVNRLDDRHGSELRAHGATVVVHALTDLLPGSA
ncbi:beta-phosphoglucomutase family hydrolase [Jatrophihabitans endophyticus]|uniref:beta-phosphoglucomutase family hydrolase n=1 Tax=Jatrophihabitans endophyticus TaxID=1206085 RepID=UPI0019E00355|nr:beta-phosphoglucomutase family hydrolase [Jatrophihabitans endophyticus]MBE7187067.1 beta-phosphoglucomutase family hydrolase [Jatrophihabitans endophyticus]